MATAHHPPAAAPARPDGLKELTVRGVVIGGFITLVFTAANVYLGLKVGLTFATSIPAAVISMAILRFFRDHTVVENNIVQTIASAAGTLSAIIFVLPGLVMLGYWKGFPYWTTVAVCFFGGVLGVMYSIPLRRALVTGSDLPYPEGVAAAEVLRVGDSSSGAEENKRGLQVITASGLAAFSFMLLTKLKVAAEGISKAVKVGSGGTMIGSSLSLALIGVGHLVGITVGIAMIVGVLISFGVILPMRTVGHLADAPTLLKSVNGVFRSDVRMIGAGTMAVAALWTLFKIIGPIVKGIRDALASTNARAAGQEVDITERDLSMKIVIGTTLASMLPIGALLWLFTRGTPLESGATGLVISAIVYILLVGLFVASVCGYMAGLIGASNSPISGVGIIVGVTCALLVKAVHGSGSGATTEALVAYTLFTTAIVFGVATISNDNLQDLKTGQLVGATPWKQQVALIIGVGFGAAIIPPILGLMNKTFGFVGAPGATENALAAPQASLISTLAKGVLGGGLDWGLLGLGALIGVVVVAIDEVLKATSHGRRSLPPLAVGMGMYLPIDLTLMIPLGALIGHFYDRWADRRHNPEGAKRLGTLLATGLIVGESLFGVLFAGIVYLRDTDAPLAIMSEDFEPTAEILGALVFAAVIAALYVWVKRVASRADTDVPARGETRA
ncbi:OPT family oligopeptide transporter [Arsenicicoccus dermatophilus]|uniref:OPT family oligopeptide transporter n=1 Tax=Arsenicicoccus dermatophilus TaxID=1076331 RepID=UPI001F4CDE65|nr:oligopeptide transporter, OPT family [Arsenicicoccus dermatophilus]MCH8614331.1 oligopeptide transporter, OPT family [Arsenicicoccus dermatophilus]